MTRKAISASHPELLVRFAKESSMSKSEMVPDVDHMDIQVRQETLTTIPGQPVMLQLPLVPSYALTTVEGKNKATIVFLNYHGLKSMMHIP